MWLLCLLGHAAHASGPAAPDETAYAIVDVASDLATYDRCKVAVLVDDQQEQAIAFRVTINREVDLSSMQPLKVFDDDLLGSPVRVVDDLPFETGFDGLVFVEGDRSVRGILPTPRLGEEIHLVAGTVQGKPYRQVAEHGVTGYIYVLDAVPHCQN